MLTRSSRPRRSASRAARCTASSGRSARCRSPRWPRSTAARSAADSSWRSPAIGASPRIRRASGSACRRCSWACFPAGGGTQLLPRLVGLPRALDLILNARRLSARRALRAGLVDEVVHPAGLERAALDRARAGRKRGVQGGRTPAERAMTWIAPARAVALRTARERVTKETHGHYPAPYKAMDAIATGLAHGIEAGFDAEADAFGELATGRVARNLIGLFVLGLRQRRAAFTGLPKADAPESIAVVGAGLMGSGIAQSAAMSGMSVRLRDIDDAAVTRGLGSVRALTEMRAQGRRRSARGQARDRARDGDKRLVRIRARGPRDRGGVRRARAQAARDRGAGGRRARRDRDRDEHLGAADRGDRARRQASGGGSSGCTSSPPCTGCSSSRSCDQEPRLMNPSRVRCPWGKPSARP